MRCLPPSYLMNLKNSTAKHITLCLLPRLLFSWRYSCTGTGEVTWFSKCANPRSHPHAFRQCPGLAPGSSTISQQGEYKVVISGSFYASECFEKEKTLGGLVNQRVELPSRSYTRVSEKRLRLDCKSFGAFIGCFLEIRVHGSKPQSP